MTFSFERLCLALIAIAGLVYVGIAAERYGFMARELKDQQSAITQLSMKIDALKAKPSIPDVQINQVTPGVGSEGGSGMGMTEPGMPVAVAPAPVDAPFPMDLIGKKSTITETWIEHVRIENKRECFTRGEDIASEVWSPNCPIVADTVLPTDKRIRVQILLDEKEPTVGHLQILKDGKKLSLPDLLLDASSAISVSYVDEKTIYVRKSGYEWYQNLKLTDGEWKQHEIPQVVLEAYPFKSKPPFDIQLGRKYTRYTETRWPPGGEGYYGEDPNWNKWALEYIFDRSTGKIVETRAVERDAK